MAGVDAGGCGQPCRSGSAAQSCGAGPRSGRDRLPTPAARLGPGSPRCADRGPRRSLASAVGAHRRLLHRRAHRAAALVGGAAGIRVFRRSVGRAHRTAGGGFDWSGRCTGHLVLPRVAAATGARGGDPDHPLALPSRRRRSRHPARAAVRGVDPRGSLGQDRAPGGAHARGTRAAATHTARPAGQGTCSHPSSPEAQLGRPGRQRHRRRRAGAGRTRLRRPLPTAGLAVAEPPGSSTRTPRSVVSRRLLRRVRRGRGD